MRISNFVVAACVFSAVCSLVQSSPVAAVAAVAAAALGSTMPFVGAQGSDLVSKTSCPIDTTQSQEWQDVDQAHCDLTSSFDGYNAASRAYRETFNQYVDDCSMNLDGSLVAGKDGCEEAKTKVARAEKEARDAYTDATGCKVELGGDYVCSEPSETYADSALGKYRAAVEKAQKATIATGAEEHNKRMPKKLSV